MRITQKLGVLVAVPLTAVSGFGAIALVNSTSVAIGAGDLWTLMRTSNAAGKLICELQDERTAVSLYLTAPGAQPSTADLDAQIVLTDAATADYTNLVRGLPDVPQATTDLIARINDELTQLRTLRSQVRTESAPALSAVIFQYRIAIADLASFRDSVARTGDAPQSIDARIRAANLLYQASEATGQEEAIVLRGAIGVPLTIAAHTEFATAKQAYFDAMEAFDPIAPEGWAEKPDEALTGPEILTAQYYEDIVSRTPPGQPAAQLDPRKWVTAMAARREAIDNVRQDLDLSTLQAIARIRDHAYRVAAAEAAAIAGTVLLAVMVSLRLGRPMIRGLKQLREGAHAVAYQHLPDAVEALRASDSLTGSTPEEFAELASQAAPVRVDTKDELAEVASAFDAVHREAIRTAAEQVLLRAGVGATFVALARRGERLTGALTGELDKAERTEQDPDRLARLFVLDHLAARMSRNNESLLVLGGESTARVRDRGVTLVDVIRAALGRIEKYRRVELDVVDSGIVVVPQAVDHLVHLCAELLDNATAFSAPDSRVTVEARRMTDRVIIQVADRGIGMTPVRRDELNARLAAPRQVDITTVRAMGLTVVGHLASWYGIVVELRPRPGGGTVAEVALPPALYSEVATVQSPAAETIEIEDWAETTSPADLSPEPVTADEAAEVFEGSALSTASSESGQTSAMPNASSFASSHSSIPFSLSGIPVAGAPAGAEEPEPSPHSSIPFSLSGVPTAAAPTEAPTEAPPPDETPDETEEEPEPVATTVHGLPIRVPQARFPADARRRRDGAGRANPAERDPERVSAAMSAFARGLTGRGSSPPKQ